MPDSRFAAHLFAAAISAAVLLAAGCSGVAFDYAPQVVIEKRVDQGVMALDSRSTFTYDESGRLASVLAESWKDGAWVNGLTTTLAWSEAGLLQSQGNDAARHVFSYNSEGALLTSTTERFSTDKNGWEPKDRETYTYDEDGRTASSTLARFDGGVWKDQSRETYTYQKSFLESVASESFVADKGTWLAGGLWTYVYDPKTELLVEIIRQDGDRAYSRHYVLTWNDETLSGYEEQKWKDGAWQPKWRMTFEHAELALVEKVFTYKDGAWQTDPDQQVEITYTKAADSELLDGPWNASPADEQRLRLYGAAPIHLK